MVFVVYYYPLKYYEPAKIKNYFLDYIAFVKKNHEHYQHLLIPL